MITEDHIIQDSIEEQSILDLASLTDWWCKHGYDHENNRFYAEVNNENIPAIDSPYVIIQRTRLLWYFSVLSQLQGYGSYQKYADILYQEIINHFYDRNNGGFYWEVDACFNLSNNRKQIYAQAFAIYALSEYHSLSKNDEALAIAMQTFDMIETHAWDNQLSGYLEALDHTWNVLDDFRLSPKDMNEPKTMNTHLHVLEAYTSLSRIAKSDKVKVSLERLLRLYADKFFNAVTGHFELFFDMNWKLKSDIVSFGHDIESAWLMQEAAEVLGDSEILRMTKKLSIKIADVTLDEGVSPVGGLRNEIENGRLDTSYDWWPQAEAVVGFLYTYKVTTDSKYKDKAHEIFSFIHKNIIDKERGEWYWKIDEKLEHVQSFSKSSAWKAPYHNGRMYFELLKMACIAKG